jgi:nucleotide-binding universal stress UspA family protein
MFERILVPLDGSVRAELVLSQVGRILRREDAEILLLRVVDIPQPIGGVEIAGGLDIPALRQQAREDAQNYLHDMAQRFAGKADKVHGRVAEGPAAQTILDSARKEGVTMIAMSTHGRSGVARWTIGSVAEKVARACDVPLLLVRSFRRNPQGDLEPSLPEEFPFRRILVPVDGSPTSMSIIGSAEKFAQLYDSEVVVLHVRPPYIPASPMLPGMEAGLPAIQPPPIRADKDETTSKAADRFRHAGLKVRRMTLEGEAASEILDLSKAEAVDLIALGTHGRSGISRWALGSVAERVLRGAEVPLLILRSPSPQTT